MVQRLGVPLEDVAAKTLELYLAHGTTLAGLVASGYQVDFDDWHAFVHHEALDYKTLLHPDASLRDILCSIDLPKYILTNADRKHMDLCLERLGLSDCFQGFYYFENVMEMAAARGVDTARTVVCKPSALAYQTVAEHLGVSLSEVLFFDDSTRNVAAARALGAYSVLVGVSAEVAAAPAPPPCADLALPTMHALPVAMPQLLDQPGLVHDDHGHGRAAQQQVEAVAVSSGVAITVPGP